MIIWVLVSYFFAVSWDSTPINFWVFWAFFFVGVLLLGQVNEHYLYRKKGKLVLSETEIMFNERVLDKDEPVVIYYNNARDWMGQWGWFGSYSKYKSDKWLGLPHLIDKIILGEEEYCVKIKTTRQMELFEQAIEFICEHHCNSIFYYSSESLRHHHGEEYWEKR